MSNTPRGSGGAQSAWVVNWRNPQARKNKSWENDGFVHVNGPILTLMKEDGTKIGQKNHIKSLSEDMEISIAGKEIRMDYSISVSEMWSKIRGEGTSRSTPAPAPTPVVRTGFFSRSTDSQTTPQPRQPSRAMQGRMSTPASDVHGSTSVKALYQDSTTTSLARSKPTTSLARSSSKKQSFGVSDDVFRADTPEHGEDGSGAAVPAPGSATKTWLDPKKHLQKPFKFPTPIRKSSPSVEYGSPSTSTSTSIPNSRTAKGKSKMNEEIKSRDEEGHDSDQEDEEARKTTSRANFASSRADAMARSSSERSKGVKEGRIERMRNAGRKDAYTAQAAEGDEEGGIDGITPPKKRKLDCESAERDQARLGPIRKPRVSAADLALSRSMAGSKPATLSKSPGTDQEDPIQCRKPTSTSSSSSKPKSRPPPAHSSDAEVQLQPKPEPLDPDSAPLFLDASSYQDDEFGIETSGIVAEMDWDEGNDLNEDGLFDVHEEVTKGADVGSPPVVSTKASMKAAKVSAAKEGQEAGEPSARTKYFTCQWRNQTTRKNSTWQGDGVLRIDKNGKATLRDTETGKELASTTFAKSIGLEDDVIVRIAGKEIELGSLSDRQAYDGGDPMITTTASSSSLNRLPVPSSYRPLKPSPGRFSPITTLKSSSPALTKGFAVPGVVSTPHSAAGGIKTDSFYGKSKSTGQHAIKGPGPLFDPSQEGAIVMKRPDSEHQQTYNPKNYPVVDVVLDPKIGSKLRPHQVEGVKFMYEAAIGMRTTGQGCILADEMGLGKTLQSIALMWTLIKQNPYYRQGFNRAGVIEKAMIVCPVTLMKNWASEIKNWLGPNALRVLVAEGPDSVKTFANSRSYQVLIVGYEKLTGSIDHAKYAQPPIGLVICDEGHRLKSADTKTTKALASLSCLRRVILSGTPIQNNLQEFFAMMDFVNPGLLRDSAYFKKNYEQPILKSRRSGASKEEKRAGKEASESLATIQRNFFLRRTADLLKKHLPPKLEYTVFVVPTRREVEIYEQILSSGTVRSLLSGKGGREQLGLLTLLRKCATTPGLLMRDAQTNIEQRGDESIFQPELTRLFPPDIPYNDFKLSGKLIALGAMLRELHEKTDEKIVVVSNFTQTLDIVERFCRKQKYPLCRLDGKTDQKERIPIVKNYNSLSRKHQFVFLLSSKSGGTGLNIIGASRLVLLDSEWNPSTDLQAMARIHRDGQTRTCVIYRFLTSGTIDEKIYQRQITKLALSGSVMDEDSTATSVNKGDAFTVDDLKNIFRLHPDTACQTHDLLDCGCHQGENSDSVPSQQSKEAKDSASESGDEDGDEEDEDEGEEFGGFVPASQWAAGEHADKRALKKARRNLSILKTWNHFDCSDWGHTAVHLEDEFLRDLILKLYLDVDTDERVLNPISHMTEEEKREAEQGRRCEIRGGQIGWVFEKKTDDKKNKTNTNTNTKNAGNGDRKGTRDEGEKGFQPDDEVKQGFELEHDHEALYSSEGEY